MKWRSGCLAQQSTLSDEMTACNQWIAKPVLRKLSKSDADY